MTVRHEETVPEDAAMWAALTVLVILVVVLIVFCCIPVYKALAKRWRHWDDLDNDPRWARDTFQFSPTSPQLDRDTKYNRLSASSSTFSRSSSFRVNKLDRLPDAGCPLPRMEDQVEIKMPPAYTDIFTTIGEEESLGSPPKYYSNSPSEEEVATNTTTTDGADKTEVENDKKKKVKSNKSYKKIKKST